MKFALLVGIILAVSGVAIAQGTLSPTNTIVNHGGSVTISCIANCGTGGSWTCTTCSGILSGATSTTVLYTAPGTIAAKQSVGGYQLLPNDHIFNTDISGLAAASNSATVMTNVGANPVTFLASFPINYTNASTPTDNMTFANTPANNGIFPSPQWPSVNIEGSWFDALVNANSDHHRITVDTTTGNLAEIYQYYAQAPVTSCMVNASNSATCTITPTPTSSGFIRRAALGSTIQIGGFTSGDTYLNGSFTLTAATVTTVTFNITHAAASSSTIGQATLGIGSIPANVNSQNGLKYTYPDYGLPLNGATDAGGMFLEPLTLKSQEFVTAYVNGGTVNHALRMTLSNGLICGSNVANSCVIGAAGNATGTRHIWPATAEAFSGGGTIPYGARFRLKSAFNISSFSAGAQIILNTLKKYGVILADGGISWQVTTDSDNMPAAEVSALQEIGNAAIATSNWEAVDDSSLMESSTTGGVNTGEVISYTSSTGTVTTHINLQGSSVNVNTNQYYIMAGTPAQQLTIYSNEAFTCSISPAVGSITSGCLYTPPVSEATVTTTTVTITSTVNAAVKASMIVYVTPGSIRFIQCAISFGGCDSSGNYTDSLGNVWYGSGQFGIGMLTNPQLQGCCQNDASFANITDKQLWWNELANSGSGTGDYKIDLHVPVGTYQIVYRNGTYAVTIGQDVRYFYTQGNLIGTFDPTLLAGGIHLPYTLTTTAVVGSNNLLTFYNAGVGNQTLNGGRISSISVIPGVGNSISGSGLGGTSKIGGQASIH